jgi:carotenoid cleavage dioxygenase
VTAIDAERQPYLEGVYAPVGDEIDAVDLAVTGAIPPALDGTFLRNGPNPMFAPKGRYHVFDGDGMVHGLTLRDGKASYRNRWVRSRGLDAEIEAGLSLYGGMANADFPSPDEVGDAGAMKNVANTHVIRHAGHVLCLWEAGPPTAITPALDTLGPYDFGGALAGPMTAHPKVDPDTGELCFFGYSAVPPYLRYHVADASGRLLRTVDIDLPAPVMMHDFVVTDRHVVFFDAPAVFDFTSFAAGGPMLRWKPELGTRIGVMPRDGDAADVVWTEIDPCYVFHFLNAWTDGDEVHIDGCRLAHMDIGLEPGRSPVLDDGEEPGSFLTRFTVDLASGTATWSRIAERPGDFPRINDDRAGLTNRYGYVATFADGRDGDGAFDSITKHNLAVGAAEIHDFGPGHVTGEAVFAADPHGTVEDDGWLLSYVWDAATDSTDLVILDARDIAADPVARVHLPRRVPFGFHGSWLPTIS